MPNYQYIYHICDEGLTFYDQNSGENVLFDAKHCAVLGMAMSWRSSLSSVYNARIIYSEYISDETKNLIKQYAYRVGVITQDSENFLSYSCEKYRYWLVSQGIPYEASEAQPPLFFNEITNRDCIFAFVKGFILETMDEETEAYWLSDNKIKIRLRNKNFADNFIDICRYAGLLKDTYEVGQNYTNDGYYVIFEDDESLAKENLCEWLLDQSLGFEAGTEKIEEPRGNQKESPDSPEAELPALSGYKFAWEDDEDPNKQYITYDGTDKQFPAVEAGPRADLPIEDVVVKYRLSSSTQWLNEPPSIQFVGNYGMVAKVSPGPGHEEDFRPCFMSCGLNIVKRKALIRGNQTIVNYSGEDFTLSGVLPETDIEGVSESGIAEVDTLAVDLSKCKKYSNIGSFSISIPVDAVSVGRTNNNVFISYLDNYEISTSAGTLTIEEPSAVVEVPQESFAPWNETTEEFTFEIPAENNGVFLVPLRPVDYKRTCTINGISLSVASAPSTAVNVSVYGMPGDEYDDSSDYLLYTGSVVLTPGDQKIDFSTAFTISDYSVKNVFIVIENTSTTQSVVLKEAVYPGEGAQYQISTEESIYNFPVENWPYCVRCLFWRNQEAVTSRVSCFIDGYNQSTSSLFPVVGGLYQTTSATTPLGASCFFVKKSEIPFFGNELHSVKLKIDSFQNQDVTYPTTVRLYATASEWDYFDGESLPTLSNLIGETVIEDEPTDWIEIVNISDWKPEDSAEGFIFRVECSSGMIEVENTVSETPAGVYSAASVGFANAGFSVTTNEAEIQKIAKRPVVSLEWGDVSSTASPAENKKDVAVWIPETMPLGFSELMDFSGVYSFGTGDLVEVVSSNGSNWFCMDDKNGGFGIVAKEDRKNIRSVSLSMCIYAVPNFETDEAEQEVVLDFGNLGDASIMVGKDYNGDVYRYVRMTLPATSSGDDFFCVLYTVNDCKLYFKDVVMVVDYIT